MVAESPAMAFPTLISNSRQDISLDHLVFRARSKTLFLSFSIVTLFAVVSTHSLAIDLAQKGKLTIDEKEAKNVAFFSTPEQKERLASDPTQWRPIVDEALTVQEWLQSPLRAALTAEERAAVSYRTRLADVRAGVDALVQRDLERLRADMPGLEARARELWLVDEGKYFSPTTAKVNLIFIDAQKRGLATSSTRYQQIVRRLKRGEAFDKVARAMSDIVPGQKVALPVPMNVTLPAIEGAARRAIFRDLKLGEVSAPIPTPEGWVVAQVLEIKKPARQPFEDVKQPLMEKILADATETARLAVMAKLADPPVVYSAALMPDPKKERDAHAAASAASQIAIEMSKRNMTAEEVERRLKELLERAKSAPPVGTPPDIPTRP